MFELNSELDFYIALGKAACRSYQHFEQKRYLRLPFFHFRKQKVIQELFKYN
jgi:hypothetical protein